MAGRETELFYLSSSVFINQFAISNAFMRLLASVICDLYLSELLHLTPENAQGIRTNREGIY